jgi:hypothetical protein
MSSPFSPLTSEIDEVAAATPLSPAAEVPVDGFALLVMKFLVWTEDNKRNKV